MDNLAASIVLQLNSSRFFTKFSNRLPSTAKRSGCAKIKADAKREVLVELLENHPSVFQNELEFFSLMHHQSAKY